MGVGVEGGYHGLCAAALGVGRDTALPHVPPHPIAGAQPNLAWSWQHEAWGVLAGGGDQV